MQLSYTHYQRCNQHNTRSIDLATHITMHMITEVDEDLGEDEGLLLSDRRHSHILRFAQYRGVVPQAIALLILVIFLVVLVSKWLVATTTKELRNIFEEQSLLTPPFATARLNIVRVYQYPFESIHHDISSDLFHNCSQDQYTPRGHGWRDTYAMEYWITSKISKWSKPTSGRYFIPYSYLQDFAPAGQQGDIFEVLFTTNPAEADFFFVPQLTTCLTHGLLPQQGLSEASQRIASDYLSPLLHQIIHRHPYWNDSNPVDTPGANHLFVFSWDKGICLMKSIIPLLQHAIKLQGYGVASLHPRQQNDAACFNPVTDIVVPQASWRVPDAALVEPSQQNYIRRRPVLAPLKAPVSQRPTMLYMRGTVYSKGDVNEGYSLGVRQNLARLAANMSLVDPHQSFIVIVEGGSINYEKEMLDARIGICARGWAPWTSRLQDVMNLETVPLIIADEITLPYEQLVDWRLFALKFSESSVPKLIDRVRPLLSNLSEKQQQVWLHAQYFSWHGDDHYNAFAMLMRELFVKKRKKSTEPVSVMIIGSSVANIEIDH